VGKARGAMYIPKHFEETDLRVLHALVEAHPLGAWVTQDGAGLAANHLPFLLKRDQGALGTLVGHVARANGIWREFSRTAQSLVIFQGPEAYITPSWYPGKAQHGKVVPTWNYAVVHVRGIPRTFEERERLLGHVRELTARHEAREEAPWGVADAPGDFIDKMLGAIVGIEMPIEGIEGKWKAGQNRSAEDRVGAAEGLGKREGGAAMAAIMRGRAGPGA
jgi:transcriptional regulator